MGIIQVRRANVILDVPDYQEAEYLAKGFDVLGPDGEVLAKATPNDPNSLKKAYADLLKENEELKKEIDTLKQQLTSEPVEAEPKEIEEVEEEPEEEFTPINKRGKKTKK